MVPVIVQKKVCVLLDKRRRALDGINCNSSRLRCTRKEKGGKRKDEEKSLVIHGLDTGRRKMTWS